MLSPALKVIGPALLLILHAVPASAEPTPAQLQAENARLRSRVAELEAELNRIRERLATTETVKRQLEVKSARLEARTARIEKEAVDAWVVEGVDEAGRPFVATEFLPMKVTFGKARHHWMKVQVPTDAAASAPEARIEFKTASSGGIYRSIRRLVLVVDDEQVSLPLEDYENRRRGGSGASRHRVRRDDERFNVTLPLAKLATLVEAGRPEGRLGPTRFTFTREQVLAIKALVRKTGSG